jgi:hypothetical protein
VSVLWVRFFSDEISLEWRSLNPFIHPTKREPDMQARVRFSFRSLISPHFISG